MVLTILALSLALVTQTEVQVGANERTVNRTFYAADSGLGVAAAEALASGRYTGMTVILNKVSVGFGSGASNIADRVVITAFVPIQTVRCDWCPANADGVPKFWKVNHAVNRHRAADRLDRQRRSARHRDAARAEDPERDVRVPALAYPAGRIDSHGPRGAGVRSSSRRRNLFRRGYLMSPRNWSYRPHRVRLVHATAADSRCWRCWRRRRVDGDDRDLLRSSIADPYLFILLDTSGSMNWAPEERRLPDRRLLRAPPGRRSRPPRPTRPSRRSSRC